MIYESEYVAEIIYKTRPYFGAVWKTGLFRGGRGEVFNDILYRVDLGH